MFLNTSTLTYMYMYHRVIIYGISDSGVFIWDYLLYIMFLNLNMIRYFLNTLLKQWKIRWSQIEIRTGLSISFYVPLTMYSYSRIWPIPMARLKYFTDRGVQGIFRGLKFLPKGIFWVYQRRSDFFGSQKIKRRDFLGIYFSSAQINNNINTIYSWCGIFWGILKCRDFFGRQILKFGFFWV